MQQSETGSLDDVCLMMSLGADGRIGNISADSRLPRKLGVGYVPSLEGKPVDQYLAQWQVLPGLQPLLDDIHGMLSQGKSFQHSERIEDGNGGTTLQINGQVLNGGSQAKTYLLQIQDVSGLVHDGAEHARESEQCLRESVHALLTPMATFGGLVDHMAKHYKAALGATDPQERARHEQEADKLLEGVLDAGVKEFCRRGEEELRQALTYRAPHQQESNEPVKLYDEVILPILKVHKLIAAKKQVDIGHPDPAPEYVLNYPRDMQLSLRKAVMNCLSNAVKCVPFEGKLTIGTDESPASVDIVIFNTYDPGKACPAGHGLGNTMTEDMLSRMGGAFTFGPKRPGGGYEQRITLPRAYTPSA